MGWQEFGLVLVLVLGVALVLGQWTALALGSAGMLMLYLARGEMALNTVGSVIWNTANSYVLIAVPMFLLLGEIILRSGVSSHFYRGVAALMGRTPGGLLHANIVACALFSAISGSSVATAAAVGSVAIPEMLKRRYQPKLLFGSLAAGGTLGILIPPSIVMILYGALVEESIVKLFMAGMIPGILMAGLFMVYIALHVLVRRGDVPAEEERVVGAERWRLSLHVLPIVGLFLTVLGSMFFGIATPTEAAVVGALGALALAWGYGGLTWAVFWQALIATTRVTCMVLFIIIGAQILSNALTYTGVSRGVSEWIVGLELSRWMLFLALVVLYLVLGCFVDGVSMIYITLPVLFPVVVQAGFNPIWFGVILTILIELGQITPPVGLNLFTIHGISGGYPFSDVVIGSVPFVLVMLFTILLLCFWPALALWFPATI
ncbi:MAG: TRAP transporter large permease subunit [Alphaproteobacteria bacterium]|nr:TRAP transporter large permease subunit [Alphaproteobacteria bacterium]